MITYHLTVYTFFSTLIRNRGSDPAVLRVGLTTFAVDGHQFGLLHSVSKYDDFDKAFTKLEE